MPPRCAETAKPRRLKRLANRAPASGAAADGRCAQSRLVLRTHAFGGPALMEQPVGRRVAGFFTCCLADGLQGNLDHFPDLAVQIRDRFGWQSAGTAVRGKASAPEYLVRHPVSNAGKEFLHEEHGFERRFASALEDFSEFLDGETPGRKLFWHFVPPLGIGCASGKANPPKEAEVVEDQRVCLCKEDEMIVLAGLEVCSREAQLASHAEMKSDGRRREAEEHLLCFPVGRKEFRTRKSLADLRFRAAAEDAFRAVEMHSDDLLAECRRPAFPEKFDFGEFWHG